MLSMLTNGLKKLETSQEQESGEQYGGKAKLNEVDSNFQRNVSDTVAAPTQLF